MGRLYAEIVVVALLLAALGVMQLRLSDARLAHETTKTELAQAKAAIETQNAGIDTAAADGRSIAAAADTAALRSLAAGAGPRADIDRAGSGPQEMNRWITSTFVK